MSGYQNAVLIYNPVSGKNRRNPRLIQRIIAVLGDAGIPVRGLPTTGPRTAEALARTAIERDGADLVLVAGGDGTINEAINGVAPSRVPVGIIPAGTANVMACELGLGTRPEIAAGRITQCVPERLALGRLRNAEGERYFLAMAGVGLDATIVYDVSGPLKAATGKLAYWVGGIKHLTRPLAQFETHLHDRVYKCGFALASRVRNYGGDLEIACGANLLEDDFEVVLFSGRNPLRYAVYFLAVLGRFLPGMRGITVRREHRLEFRAPEDRRIYVQVDGEYAGRLPATVDIVPDALSLLIPADFRNRTPARVIEAIQAPKLSIADFSSS